MGKDVYIIPKGQINAPDQLDCMSTLRPDTSMAYMQGKVQRLQEMLAAKNAEVERLQKLKDYWADIVHSERKEYNALQDSTMHDETLLLECYDRLMDMDRFIDVQDKLRERLGIK